MRFYPNPNHLPIQGDKRERRFFAIFPIRIKHEIRWLEFVHISESYWYGDWSYDEFLNP